jgi:serine phosphatase RsbU (regulator of sigma subunit)
MHGVTAERATRVALAALPGLAIAGVAIADLSVGRSVVLGLVVVAPLLAANVGGPRLTAAYAVAALVAGALLGVYDHAYEPGDARNAQMVRLAVIAVMGLLAVFLARYRIERERRLTQVTKVADAAQRAILLPVPERLGQVRVAVHYESAAREALIGGDMYGFVLTDHGLRVLVGDVRGKGLDAVRLSAQVLATFRERAGDNPDLNTLLDRLDHTVAHVAESEEDFVTAVVVQIGDDGVLTVANAGHPAPLLLSHDDGSRLLDVQPPRPPLGLGGRSGTLTTRISAHDRLLLYTDGLTEARNPRTRGFLPAQQIVAAVRARDAVSDAVGELRDDVLRWSGGALHDDIALVLLEYRPGTAAEREATGRGAASSLG